MLSTAILAKLRDCFEKFLLMPQDISASTTRLLGCFCMSVLTMFLEIGGKFVWWVVGGTMVEGKLSVTLWSNHLS